MDPVIFGLAATAALLFGLRRKRTARPDADARRKAEYRETLAVIEQWREGR